MKKSAIALVSIFLLTLFLPITVLAQGDQPNVPTPPPAGVYILDTLDWLTPAQEAEINNAVAKLDSDQLAEIAVVTLDNCGEDKLKFRNDLFREWGIGHADDNDGLLIMVCWYGGDKSRRSLEQEVGYGLEGTIPDLLTSKVAKQYFVPAFSTGVADTEVVWTGKAGEALTTMVRAYDGIIRGNTPSELVDRPDNSGSVLFWIVVIIVVLLVLIVLIGMFSDGSSGSGGGWSSSSNSSSWGSSDSGGSSFGGGSSGGGGSSTGF